MSDELLELPEGWEWTDVKSISSVITGKTPSTSNADFWDGGIPFVTPSQIDPSGSILPPNRTLTDLGAAQARIISENSTLAVCIGTVGKIGLLDRPSVINQQLNALTPNKNIHAKFLYYWSQYFLRSWIIENASATVNAAILNKSRLENAPVILPPLNEQRRIVAKIEELRERSQKARSHLSAIPNLCNKFRQSVLAAAFRGDLTADWREQNPDVETASVLLERIKIRQGNFSKNYKAKKSSSTELTDFISNESLNLPEGWSFTTAVESCIDVVDCHNKTAPYTNTGIKLIRTSNIRNGVINLKDTKFVDQPTYKFWSRRCPPQPGDIIFTREAPMAEVGMIPPGETICMGQRMMLLRVDNEDLLAEYLLYVLQAPLIQKYAEEIAVGTGVKHLRVKDVEQLPIVVPPLHEQKLIVKTIKELFKVIELVEEQYYANDTYLAHLDRSILAKAFRGELVEQDPNDEPASVLLERIRAEREQQAQGKAKKPGKNGQRTIKTDPP